MVGIQSEDIYKNVQGDDKEDFESRFRKNVAKAEKKFREKQLPFCSACAWMDFRDTIERMKNDVERQLGYGPGAHLPVEVLGKVNEFRDLPDKFDFDKYTTGWELLGESENRETRTNAMGEKFNVITSYNLNYVCKRYKHGYSLEVNKEVYDKLKTKPHE